MRKMCWISAGRDVYEGEVHTPWTELCHRSILNICRLDPIYSNYWILSRIVTLAYFSKLVYEAH